jgi:predicted DNA-binding transcriptional regulator AlpA
MRENVPEILLTPADAAAFLKLSLSWLAKSRQRAEGPPYVKLGRSVRYSPSALVAWLRSNQR